MQKRKQLSICPFILTVTILFAALSGHAQEKSHAQKMTDKMKTELSLTEEQYPRVLAANEQFAAQVAALKDGGGSRLSKLKKFKAMDEDLEKALKNILTEEQYTNYREQKKKNRAKARGGSQDKS